jgi:cytoskeletal protein CcmA (bactofilin family)
MKKRSIVPLTLALVAAMVSAGFSDIRIRGGAMSAEVSSSGTIRINGSIVGEFSSNGTVRKSGSIVGEVSSNGTIRKGGSIAGEIQSDGTLRRSGSIIGAIEAGGNIRKGGSIWGSASSCCGNYADMRAVAAVLVFFSNDFGFQID